VRWLPIGPAAGAGWGRAAAGLLVPELVRLLGELAQGSPLPIDG
jgi:hypothetical protein